MSESQESREASKELNYGASLEELQRILKGIEEDRFDLDELGTQVERAAHLLKVCQAKIDATEMQVKGIISELEGSEES